MNKHAIVMVGTFLTDRERERERDGERGERGRERLITEGDNKVVSLRLRLKHT